MAEVHGTYLDSFEKLTSFPPIQTVDDADHFCEELRAALRMHKDVVLRMKVARSPAGCRVGVGLLIARSGVGLLAFRRRLH